MNRTHYFGLCALCIVVLFLSLATYVYLHTPRDAKEAAVEKGLGSGEMHVFTDRNGNSVSFDAYEGKVRVVSSWASWNPFSAADLAVLNAVSAEYASRGEPVVFIAINRKETKEQAERFLTAIENNLEHLAIVLDQNDTFYASIDGYAMPETVIYDNRGNIASHVRGVQSKEQLITLIEEAKVRQ